MNVEKRKKWRNYGIIALALGAALFGSFQYISSYSTVSGNINGKEMPICSVEIEEKKVALTFDAAWGNEDTARILDILKKHKVQATFFMTGDWVEKYPEEVKAVKEAGHDLANHSASHRSMIGLEKEEQRQEILSVHEKVLELTGEEMRLFRVPYDNYDDEIIRNIQACGYYPIQWSVDSLDWKDYGVKDIVETVLESRELKNGAIILLHNGTKYTAEALDDLLTELEKKGYQMVPVSKLIYKKGFYLDAAGRQLKKK
ncbi:polysaccharide deacetylase family protein [Sporofaciens musculi]|jgi:polysaccharide deacetylase family sporulation protein PdaB|uniref:polysaccharide deacetylase family protein n=1 Tax=Sporofaciens musculi TaxID=2681861 RepID=UPI0025707224|nr:polysaccharide deacetylase family protein [Sporofaciens musculi]